MSNLSVKRSIESLSLLEINHSNKLFKTRIIIHLYKGERYIYMNFENYKLMKLFKLHYGIGNYLSTLYILSSGYHTFSSYKIFPFFPDNQRLNHVYGLINQKLIYFYVFFMKNKLSYTSYWSIRYTNKYPCRGQRTRSNARTAFRLHNYNKFMQQ